MISQCLDRLELRPHPRAPLACVAADHLRCGGLALIPGTKGTLWLTITFFTLAMIGMKAYLPAFWALPSLFLTESAAAASIGLINSFGNLGGAVGPSVVGVVKQATGEYRYGLWFLSASVIVSALIIVSLGIGSRVRPATVEATRDPEPEAIAEPA